MKKNMKTGLGVLLMGSLLVGATGCGSDASSTGAAATQSLTQGKSFLERIQFAQATPGAEGIELALAIDGSRSAGDVGAMDATDVAMLQKGKDGVFDIFPMEGMDIRGTATCVDEACTSVRANLVPNEASLGFGEAGLEITASSRAKCTVKSLAATEDALFVALQQSLKKRVSVSLVEKSEGTAKFLAISSDGAAPFFRADLQPSADAYFDSVQVDASGSVTRTPMAVQIASAELAKAPFHLRTILNHQGQPSTEVNCAF